MSLSVYKHFSIAKDFLLFSYNLKSYMREFLLDQQSHLCSHIRLDKECISQISFFLQ